MRIIIIWPLYFDMHLQCAQWASVWQQYNCLYIPETDKRSRCHEFHVLALDLLVPSPLCQRISPAWCMANYARIINASWENFRHEHNSFIILSAYMALNQYFRWPKEFWWLGIEPVMVPSAVSLAGLDEVILLGDHCLHIIAQCTAPQKLQSKFYTILVQ